MLGTFWHVPVFLMIGGFFIKEEELCRPTIFLKKKWNTLYVKMLIFYFIFILLHNSFFGIGFYSTTAIYNGKHIYPLVTFADYLKQFGWALLAAREPFLSAMWFINLMFIGMCLISISSWILKKSSSSKENYENKQALVIFFLAFISCFISHGLGFSIIRFTPSLCAALLIYCGYIINKKFKLAFNNKYIFIVCFFLVYEMCMLCGSVSLAGDNYFDIVILIIGTFCSLYCLCFIAKKIEFTILGKCLSYCGNKSYYIMALHLLGFKVATAFFTILGIKKPFDELHSPAENLFELMIYAICGVCFSLLVEKIMQLSTHNEFFKKTTVK